MITAPVSWNVSPTTSCNCSIAFPIQAKTCEGSPCVSAIKPSSDTDRPNRTFPMFILLFIGTVCTTDCSGDILSPLLEGGNGRPDGTTRLGYGQPIPDAGARVVST